MNMLKNPSQWEKINQHPNEPKVEYKKTDIRKDARNIVAAYDISPKMQVHVSFDIIVPDWCR